MPRKTATRICTLLIGVVVMLLFASTTSAQSCPPPPEPCKVPLFNSTCTNGSNGVLTCYFGGYGTCCNPTIQASTNSSGGDTCNNAGTCYIDVVGQTTYSTCCCASAYVNSDCSAFTGGAICETETTV